MIALGRTLVMIFFGPFILGGAFISVTIWWELVKALFETCKTLLV